MVYLNIKRTRKKKYYSLRESKREGNKIISKDILNLGNNLSEITLNKINNLGDSKIRNSIKTIKKTLIKEKYIELSNKKQRKGNKYFTREQNVGINSAVEHYKREFRKLNKIDRLKIIENTNIKFIMENTSIEPDETPYKNTKEIKKVLESKFTKSKRSIIQTRYLLNTKEILDFLYKERPPLNEELIIKIHNHLSRDSIREEEFRKEKIKIPSKNMKPSHPEHIKSELKKLLSWYNINKIKIPPLALITLFHHKFEKIHPFRGLNGQTGRIIMNYQLSQLGYPPIIIPSKSKEEYHKVMNKAYPCLKKDLLSTDMRYYKDLMDFMQKQFVKTYWDNFVV